MCKLSACDSFLIALLCLFRFEWVRDFCTAEEFALETHSRWEIHWFSPCSSSTRFVIVSQPPTPRTLFSRRDFSCLYACMRVYCRVYSRRSNGINYADISRIKSNNIPMPPPSAFMREQRRGRRRSLLTSISNKLLRRLSFHSSIHP